MPNNQKSNNYNHEQNNPLSLLCNVDEVVHRYYLNGFVQTGLPLNTQSNGKNLSILVMSDNAGNVIDIIDVQTTDGKVTYKKPSNPHVILSNNHDTRGFIPSSYENGQRSFSLGFPKGNENLMPFDRSYFSGNDGISIYERTRVWEVALSYLDDNLKTPENYPVIKDYLDKASDEYYKHINRTTTTEVNSENIKSELSSIIDSNDMDGFASVMKREALNLRVKQAQTVLDRLYSTAIDPSKSEFDHMTAAIDIPMQQMAVEYAKISIETFEKHRLLFEERGIATAIGMASESSYKAIENEIAYQRSLLSLSLDSQYQPLDVDKKDTISDQMSISERQAYISDLIALQSSHPFNVDKSNSDYLDVTIANEWAQMFYVANNRSVIEDPNTVFKYKNALDFSSAIINNELQYPDGSKTIHYGISTNEYAKHLASAQIGLKTYHFVGEDPRFSSKGLVSESVLGTKIDPFLCTNKTYQGMTQREFFEYWQDKKSIVDMFRVESIHLEEIKKLYNPENKSESEEARIENVADYIRRHVKISNGLRTDEFFTSDEFAQLVRNPDSIYAKSSEGKPIQYVKTDNRIELKDVKKDPSFNLRPEYQILFESDINHKEGCVKALANIKDQIAFNNLIPNSTAQDLHVFKEFVEDHMAYNERMASLSHNRRISNGLERELIQYNSKTLDLLNNPNSDILRTLRNNSSLQYIDFNSLPTATTVNKNYKILSDYITQKDDEIYAWVSALANEVGNSQQIPSTIALSNIRNSLPFNWDSESEVEKASALLQAAGFDSVTITEDQLRKVESENEYNLNRVLHEITKEAEICRLKDSLFFDATGDISLIRGLDGRSLAHTDKYSSQAEEDAIRLLDISIALKSSDSKLDAFNKVMDSHETRNELIESIQNSVSLYKGKVDEESRIEIFKQIVGLNDDVFYLDSYEDRANKIAAALNISLADPNSQKYKDQVVILNSPEFVDEIRRIQTDILSEKYNVKDNDCICMLEKTYGIDDYRRLAKLISEDSNVDIERLGQSRYLEYLVDYYGSESEQSKIIANIQNDNSYHKMVILARNIEEMTHCGQITVAEQEKALNIAYNKAYVWATEGLTEENKEECRIRAIQYKTMIDNAANPNHVSEYMQNKQAIIREEIRSDFEKLCETVDVAFSGKERVSSGYVLNADGVISASNQYWVLQALGSDYDAANIEKALKEQMQHNPNYQSYQEIHDYGKLLKHIERLKQIVITEGESLSFQENILETTSNKNKESNKSIYDTIQISLRKHMAELDSAQKELIKLRGEMGVESEKLMKEFQTGVTETGELTIRSVAREKFVNSVMNECGKVGFDERMSLSDKCQYLSSFIRNGNPPFKSREPLCAAYVSYAKENLECVRENISSYCQGRIETIQKEFWADGLNKYSSGYDFSVSVNNDGSAIVTANSSADSIVGKLIFVDENSFAISTQAGIIRFIDAKNFDSVVESSPQDVKQAIKNVKDRERTVVTSELIASAVVYEQGNLDNAPESEKVKIKSKIDLYKRYQDELETLFKTVHEIRSDKEPLSLFIAYSPEDKQVVMLDQEYQRATQYLDEAQQNFKDIQSFNAAVSSYQMLSELRDSVHGLSIQERIAVMEKIQQEIGKSSSQFADLVQTAAKETGHESLVEDFLKAYKKLDGQQRKISNILYDQSSEMAIDDKTRQIIVNYNTAVEKLKNNQQALSEIVDKMNLPANVDKDGVMEILTHQYDIDRFPPSTSINFSNDKPDPINDNSHSNEVLPPEPPQQDNHNPVNDENDNKDLHAVALAVLGHSDIKFDDYDKRQMLELLVSEGFTNFSTAVVGANNGVAVDTSPLLDLVEEYGKTNYDFQNFCNSVKSSKAVKNYDQDPQDIKDRIDKVIRIGSSKYQSYKVALNIINGQSVENTAKRMMIQDIVHGGLNNFTQNLEKFNGSPVKTDSLILAIEDSCNNDKELQNLCKKLSKVYSSSGKNDSTDMQKRISEALENGAKESNANKSAKKDPGMSV